MVRRKVNLITVAEVIRGMGIDTMPEFILAIEGLMADTRD